MPPLHSHPNGTQQSSASRWGREDGRKGGREGGGEGIPRTFRAEWGKEKKVYADGGGRLGNSTTVHANDCPCVHGFNRVEC